MPWKIVKRYVVQPSPDQPRNNRHGTSIEPLNPVSDGDYHIKKACWRHSRGRRWSRSGAMSFYDEWPTKTSIHSASPPMKHT